MTGLVKVNTAGLVDVYSASDSLAVQANYEAYINNRRRILNAKEAVAGMLWATTLFERPEIRKLRE
jgi:unsaturated rhamnogalacturonyl hydrolase